MVAREGLEGFGINKLARAAGVSPGTIYLYCKDTEDLLFNLCLDVSDRVLKTSLTDFKSEMTFAEGLKLQWINRYEFFKKYPLEVKFAEQVRYSPIYDKTLPLLIEKYGDVLGTFINNAVDRKELVRLPFEIYWSLAFAPLYQLLGFENQAPVDCEKFTVTPTVLDKALQIVLKGLKP